MYGLQQADWMEVGHAGLGLVTASAALAAFLLTLSTGLSTRSTPIASADPRLGPTDYFVWDLRASHTDDIVLAVGDSVDVVVLRDRCVATTGHLGRSCYGCACGRRRLPGVVHAR